MLLVLAEVNFSGPKIFVNQILVTFEINHLKTSICVKDRRKVGSSEETPAGKTEAFDAIILCSKYFVPWLIPCFVHSHCHSVVVSLYCLVSCVYKLIN